MADDEVSEDDRRRGERIHEVRMALGPHARRALSQTDFAGVLTRAGKRRYYGPEISLMEQGRKPLSLEDARAIVAVDPMRRGLDWLAGGVEEPAAAESFIASKMAVPVSSAAFFAQQEAAKKKRKGNGGAA